MKFLAVLLTMFLCGVIFLHPDIASAQEARGTLAVSPAYLDISLQQPGERQRIEIVYRNNSTQPITMQMFPLDFQHTDADGTIGFLQQSGSYSYSLASFLSLEANQITINPLASKTFSVVVENRPDLSPGGHYAAVIGKIIPSSIDTLGANVSPSVSTLIFLRKIGGERYNLSLREVDNPGILRFSYPTYVQLEFQNEGNIHLVPYGTVEIRDVFGRVVKRGLLNTSSFLVMPETRRNIGVELRWINKSLPIALNTVTVQGTDSLKKTTFLYKDTFFYIHPGMLFIPLAIGIGVWLWKIRNNRHAKKNEQIQKKTLPDKHNLFRRKKKNV